jgi:hypothetical protein
VGRHALEKISSAPNGHLKEFRNLLWNARVKGGFTRIGTITVRVVKTWPSEPTVLIFGAG